MARSVRDRRDACRELMNAALEEEGWSMAPPPGQKPALLTS
jgi:hypothetical protein